jgi:hypothetical protein
MSHAEQDEPALRVPGGVRPDISGEPGRRVAGAGDFVLIPFVITPGL